MSDIDCSLNFVAGQDPYLNASTFDIVDCLADLILKFVLNGSRSDQFEVDFELLGNHVDRFLFVHRCGSCLVLPVPLLVVLFCDLLLRDQKRSQAFLGVGI